MSTAPLSAPRPSPPMPRRAGRLFALTGAVVGVIYGYDTGSISGALVFLSKDFDLTETEKGLVNSILVFGSILGALIGGKLADALGRRAAMLIVACSYAVFVALSAVAPNVEVLDAVRFLLGVAIGISIVAAPLYVAESTPARIRGASVAAYQVATVVGIVLTYFVNWGLSGGGHWRWMLGLSAIPAALVVIPLLRLPDTPRWYVLKGRTERAVEVMAATDPDADPHAEVAAVRAALTEESGGSVRSLLRKPYARAAVFVVGLGFFCQITGINAVTYYSPQIFEEMGFTGNGQNFLLPSFVELASLVAAVLAILIIDRLGRRVVLLTGIGTMAVMLAVLTVVFSAGKLHGATTWVGFAAILLFTAAFNFGFGSLIWVYASEAFPAQLRSTGASVMLTADLVANLVIAQFFPSLMAKAGAAATFAGLGVLALCALAFAAVTAPETKGRQLEEIQDYWRNGGRWPTAPEPGPVGAGPLGGSAASPASPS
ncbi:MULTISPECIES: sugar porter family MFS transporter [Streptomyces]|uniref:sugar porter family MFS transporter n=1 Tax=Streptomyces TaxID=1883 RepID=UPI001964E76F|nr:MULTISPECIES: sugar porter family MFS transporter [Streptomyces]QRX96237.1 sugar porter family MFS transporter [Streptomyces noursei]UJB45010.1 sugar porter family MFS transporter [Streptomyces sp. A1-5]